MSSETISAVLSNSEVIDSTLATQYGQCSICMMPFEFGDAVEEEQQAIRLQDCIGHGFHSECAEDMLESSGKCTVCNKRYILKDGDMPDGTMTISIYPAGKLPLQGHEMSGTIMISYCFPSGIQGPKVRCIVFKFGVLLSFTKV